MGYLINALVLICGKGQADTKEIAEQCLLELDERWGAKYPIVLKSWQTK